MPVRDARLYASQTRLLGTCCLMTSAGAVLDVRHSIEISNYFGDKHQRRRSPPRLSYLFLLHQWWTQLIVFTATRSFLQAFEHTWYAHLRILDPILWMHLHRSIRWWRWHPAHASDHLEAYLTGSVYSSFGQPGTDLVSVCRSRLHPILSSVHHSRATVDKLC